ncbi:hypothetical protein ACAG26_19075 [Mycobacterium sp. pUA109]|uniref:hypothetical protein n=1 Tax=Mycobacterium sp. pUA109 TaxID=3238982 RepID=UPI00351B1037
MTVTDNGTKKTSSEVTDDEKTEMSTRDSKTSAEASGSGPPVGSDSSDDERIEEDSKATEEDSKAVESEASSPESPVQKARRRVSISVRGLILSAVICVLVGAIGVLAWLYIGAHSKLDAQAREAGNDKRAEEIALDYAVRAAQMNYQDLNGWKVELVKGTSPELKEKLSKAANDMEQILAPLQWTSTARPLAAKVRSDTGGIYIVDAFVSVLTKTVQAPEGLQSTATYSLTIDSNKDWQISDVGGIGATPGPR